MHTKLINKGLQCCRYSVYMLFYSKKWKECLGLELLMMKSSALAAVQ